jgi:2-polyprenyl-6-methoxyphenol hydroxylase-like FAD-dependent oxidoreductase
MAGLLAARALSGRFGRVTVLDRDSLPHRPVTRGGVPQGRHTHGLLARGRQALEELLPGLTDDLVARGAGTGDLHRSARWYVGGTRLAPGDSDLLGLATSRALLEWYVRQRVTASDTVHVRERTSVLDVVWDRSRSRVTGVRFVDRDEADPSAQDAVVLEADLVVDASGRASRLPQWLRRAGYPEPPQQAVRIDVTYATRTFRRLPGHLGGDLSLVRAATPASPRGAAAVAQEEGRWSVSLAGYHGERPPVSLDGFVGHAARYGGADLARLLRDAEPLDDGASYRFASSRRWRYDRLARLPAGVLAVGDAVCSFDPVYGQGMTVCALEAVELGRCLETEEPRRTEQFFRRTARLVDGPWAMVLGGALDLGSPGRPPLRTRGVNRYLRSYVAAAAHDPELAHAYLAVANLSARPESLFSPRRVARVAAAGGRHR